MDADSALWAPPPAGAELFCSDDVDEVRAYVRRFDGEHSRVAHGHGALGYRRWQLRGEAASLGWATTGVAQTLRAALSLPCVHVAFGPGHSYRIGRQRYTPQRGDALLIPAHWELTRTQAGATLAIAFDPAALAAEVEARRGGAARSTAASRVIAEHALTAPLAAAGRELLLAAEGGDAARGRHTQAHFLALAAQAIGAAAPPAAAPTGVARERVAALRDWIEAHLTDPITLGRLCVQAGLGARSLQSAFVAHCGVPPMRYVADRRLAWVQRRLSAAPLAPEVTAVAIEAGFTHLGRFAVAYREAFGELPSRTLQRARARQR
jgi:AraC-like DNA-binding protein